VLPTVSFAGDGMRDSSIAALESLAPAILKGKLPKFSSLSARKAAHIVRYLKEHPGAHTAAELGVLVDWGPQHTRVVLGALGLRGGRKGYEWKNIGEGE
jgi:hypothetical protein